MPSTGNTIASTAAGGAQKGGKGGKAQGNQMTRVEACIRAANDIDSKHYPYVWGGGHGAAGTPSGGGYDCSGSVCAVLAAAGLWQKGSGVPADDGVISQLKSQNLIQGGQGNGNPEVTLFDNPGSHIFMRINGNYFGTSDGSGAGHSPGGGWLNDSHSDVNSFQPFHFSPQTLNQMTTYNGGGSAAAPGGGGGGGTGTQGPGAAVFAGVLDFPTFQDTATAVLLGNTGRGFMHDSQLLPFIQELCQASLRSFQSLPNGDFYAFYPDYFGETNHRKAYWDIDDIEILDGGITLSDESLVTHSYAVGNNVWPATAQPLQNMLFSTGAIDIFNAFLDPDLLTHTTGNTPDSKSSTATSSDSTKASQTGGMADVMTTAEATEFVKRYGARPLVKQYPTVRSLIYEMFLAYQNFMLAWANQFRTPFRFTFMPEVFPGGKVAFPSHGIEMYVSAVTHSWDYAEGGFTTDAVLMAPSALPGANNPDLPPNMVRAMVEPVEGAAAADPKGNKKSGATTAGNAAETVNSKASGKAVKDQHSGKTSDIGSILASF